MTGNDEPDRTDFAVICALEVEREAVCRAFRIKDRDRVLREQRRYWRGHLAVGSKSFRVIVTQLPEMANVHAAVRTSKVLQHWHPQVLLLVGIAAAADRSQRLGDVVVGRSVYYYELGKVVSGGLLPQPDMIRADHILLDTAITARKWPGRVRVPRPDGTEVRPERSVGDIASGEKVIGDARFRNEITRPDRKIRALEMEGYGFSVAALQDDKNIRHLVIRGLCDYADKSKGDEWHAYASASAAAYARHLIRDWPFEPLYRGDERKASVTPIWATSAAGHANRISDIAAVNEAVIELSSLVAAIVDSAAEIAGGLGTPLALKTSLAFPMYHVERAQEIASILRDPERSWLDEGAWRFHFTDLVEAIQENLDTLALTFDSLLSHGLGRPPEDIAELAREIQDSVTDLQALLNHSSA